MDISLIDTVFNHTNLANSSATSDNGTQSDYQVLLNLFNEDVDFIWEKSHYSPFYQLYSFKLKEDQINPSMLHFIYDDSDFEIRRRKLKFIVEGICVIVIGLLGLIGNLLSAVVLSSSKMKSSINYFLIGLSFADSFVVIEGISGLAIPTLFLHYGSRNIFEYQWVKYIPSIYAIGVTAHTTSVFFTLAVTVERYIAVMYPLKARSICTLPRAKWITFFIIFFSIMYNLPRWFEYGYKEVKLNYGKTFYFLITKPIRRSILYIQVVFGIHFLLLYGLPLAVIICINILIYRGVKVAKKERETLTVSQQNENSLTSMLLVVVFVFVLCNFLPIVNLVARIITGFPEIFIVDSVRNFLWVFNSSINFVIYYAYSEKFRLMLVDIWPESFQQLFCRSCIRGRQLHRNTMSRTLKFNSTISSFSMMTNRSNPASVESTLKRSSSESKIQIHDMNHINFEV